GYLDAVASKAPAPGGGSVAALAGALASALAAMVGRLTAGKRRFDDVKDEMSALIVEAERLRAALTARMEEDTRAFNAVMAAYKLPKDTPEEKTAREDTIQQAMTVATDVPLATARDALAAMRLAFQATQHGNPNAITDAATAAWMAMAGIQGAALNVRINAASIADQEKKAMWLAGLDEILGEAETLLEQVQATAVTRGGL
ncbi:MAG: cyclodeaminase/cyclohydrolase family protein, partial [Anaerolineae bacterium]|nr:cyclodeaminase/cyclohydrolase family protein [Anaerolineae bacterium]